MRSILLFATVIVISICAALSAAVTVKPKKKSAASDGENGRDRSGSSTASYSVYQVNLSRLLFIPPSVRASPHFSEVISTSDRAAQQRTQRLLRTWAEAVLNCQDVEDILDDAAERRCHGIHSEADPDLWTKRIQCDEWSVHAWNILGVILAPLTSGGGAAPSSLQMTHAKVRGQDVNKRTCLIQSVTCDPTYARGWYNLAQQLQLPREGFELRGRSYMKLDALLQSVRHDADNPDAWNALCAQIPAASSSSSSSSPSDVRTPVVDVGGRNITKLACYVEAVELSPRNAFAWNNLGNAIQQDAATSTFPSSAATPSGLPAVALRTGKVVTNKDCYLRAIQIDPTFSIALYNLGALLRFGEHVEFRGRGWSKKELLEEAFRHGGDALRQNANVMLHVGHALTPDDRAELARGGDKRFFSKKDCYVAALELDPTLSEAWNGLGSLLVGEKETVSLRLPDSAGAALATFSRVECYVRAIRLDPRRAATAWTNLGDLLLSRRSSSSSSSSSGGRDDDAENERFSVAVLAGSHWHTKRDCYVEVLKLEPRNSDVWGKLGVVLSEEGEPSVRVGDVGRFTARDCFVESVRHNAHNSNAWYNLGVNLGSASSTVEIRWPAAASETAAVTATTANPEKCFVEAISLLTAKREHHHRQEQQSGGAGDADRSGSFYPPEEQARDTKLLAAAWNALGNTIVHEHAVVSIPAVEPGVFARKDCYARAVETDPHFSSAWTNLGVALGSELDKKTGKLPRVAVEVRPLGIITQPECFIRAVTADERNADAWYNLVLLMQQHDEYEIRGVKMDKTAVMRKYDEVMAANPSQASMAAAGEAGRPGPQMAGTMLKAKKNGDL